MPMHSLEQRLLQLTIFLIPTNLAYHWYIQSAYINGSLVDYLIPKVYLSDLPIVALLVLWLTRLIQSKSVRKIGINPLTLLLSYLFLTGLFSSNPVSALWFWLKIVEMTLLFLYLTLHYRQKELNKIVLPPLLLGLSLQSVVGLYQYVMQSSVFGYIFLGEPTLGNSQALAKDVFSGALKVLPYGTTPHPNILAGYIVVGVLIILTACKDCTKKRWFLSLAYSCIGLSLYVLLLTRSQVALISLLIAVSIPTVNHIRLNLKSIKIIYLVRVSILVCCVLIGIAIYHSTLSIDINSITRRYRLFTYQASNFINQPIIGVGLNNSILTGVKYGLITTPSPFLQPVHSIYMLWLVETGVIGSGLLIWIILKRITVLKKRLFTTHALPLIALLFIGSLDHYPLTLQTGQLLLCLSVAHALMNE
jgi:O-antigen ligase